MAIYDLKASEAVEAARARRVTGAYERQIRVAWFLDTVHNQVALTMRQRVTLATHFLHDAMLRNISVAVGKGRITFDTKGDVSYHGFQKLTDLSRFQHSDPLQFIRENAGKKRKVAKSRVFVTTRSKPGEFPRADTSQLMKTLFTLVRPVGNSGMEGFVGTPLQYGLILELRMNRSFLVRTFREQYKKIMMLLSGPMAVRGFDRS